MRTSLIPTLLLLLSVPLQAQLLAGEIPDGGFSYDLSVDLSLELTHSSDTADLELDCDDFMDARAVLMRGAPEVDAPHVASLQFVDNDIEVCMDMAPGSQQRPKYYSFGESLDCSGDFAWQLTDQLVLGDLGGFFGIGPWTIDSQYIAFRRGGEMGWMLLSFDLNGLDEIRLQIHEILPLCQGPLSVVETEEPALFSLYPNPVLGGALHVEFTKDIRQLEVLDPSGRMLASYSGMLRTVAAPETAGSYFLRATFTDGARSVSRFVRQ